MGCGFLPQPQSSLEPNRFAPKNMTRSEANAKDTIRVDLPVQANFLKCARTATRAFPSTTTPRHSNQGCLWVRMRVRIGVPGQGGGSRQPKPKTISPSGTKTLTISLVTKPCFIETA